MRLRGGNVWCGCVGCMCRHRECVWGCMRECICGWQYMCVCIPVYRTPQSTNLCRKNCQKSVRKGGGSVLSHMHTHTLHSTQQQCFQFGSNHLLILLSSFLSLMHFNHIPSHSHSPQTTVIFPIWKQPAPRPLHLLSASSFFPSRFLSSLCRICSRHQRRGRG